MICSKSVINVHPSITIGKKMLCRDNEANQYVKKKREHIEKLCSTIENAG